ncbi:ATP-binding protein [Aliiroseovarius sp.]|uniref:ATP-binding protein n=1 Tax=Aliiroseovarius sp. TaxID=1872442 RepID=UPI003BACFF7F
MTNKSVSQQILALRCIFADNPAYFDLHKRFHQLLEHRRAELAAGVTNEARGIALIGSSGSGKTTAVKRLIRSLDSPLNENREGTSCEVLSFPVPSPATLKFVGQTGLQAIGYPLRRDKTSHIIWDMFKDHLRARRTLFLHLDEAQDLASHQTPREMQSVINTLKSLMQNQQWPVGMILSGMPALKEMLNHDPQLARRFFPIEFPSLNAVQDTEQVLCTVSYYSQHAELPVCDDLLTPSFAARLIQAADGEFGLMIEYTILAIENALRQGSSELGIANFRSSFSTKSGCLDGLNPFVVADFERIDCRKLLAGVV